VRRVWRGDGGTASELATRLAGSSDLYERSGRRPYASINFVTSHDGFSLQDLVSYNDKHNEANGEGNADGDNHNLSWNCGAEGPTDDPAIVELRERQKRNLFSTLLLSQGVPMIRGGDELSHTQHGNNNAYCQDNEISWLDWDLDDRRRAFLAFARRVLQLRRASGALRRRRFLHGHPVPGTDTKDITWYAPSGSEMTDAQWHADSARCLGVRLAPEPEAGDEEAPPDTLLLIFNTGTEPVPFKLPPLDPGNRWEIVLDTADGAAPRRPIPGGRRHEMPPRAVVVLRLVSYGTDTRPAKEASP